MPSPGIIGVFDRSHYEDVLIARVRELAPPEEIERRYGAINDFEAELVESGVTIVKCMLHISPEEQKERLLARLDDPTKHWKYNPNDLAERARWGDYRAAYETALERNNTDVAPVARHPGGQEVVPQPGCRQPAAGDPARPRPAVAEGRLRRRGRAAAAAGRGADHLDAPMDAR